MSNEKQRAATPPVSQSEEPAPYPAVVRAWVKLDGQQVPIEIGIPAKVLDGLRADVAANRGPWRAGIVGPVAVRIAGGSPKPSGTVDRDKCRPKRKPREVERRYP